MNYWIVKSDPESYSFPDLLRDSSTEWTGVRNYAARLHLNAMKKGDIVMVYHSNVEKAIMGHCKVAKAAYPDPTASEGEWLAVDLASPKALKRPVSLAEMKTHPELGNIGLIKIGRLSVMPLNEEEYRFIVKLSEHSA